MTDPTIERLNVSNNSFDWQSATQEEVTHQYTPAQHAKKPLPEYLTDYHRISSQFSSSTLLSKSLPLLIYIHGGYWQRLSAADSLFNAADAIKERVSLHAVEYTIAPHATIEQMVDECMNDVLHIIDELSPSSVVLSGCSAGAHLSAMCLRDERIASQLSGVALLSGIYDIRPIVVTPINEPLGLDDQRATSLSPILLPNAGHPSHALLAVGRHESDEFIRQNHAYGEHLQAQGTDTQTMVVDNRDHFDLPYDLLARGTRVGDWVLTHLGL
jgi:arylformamidase